jgi:hypothetical protein
VCVVSSVCVLSFSLVFLLYYSKKVSHRHRNAMNRKRRKKQKRKQKKRREKKSTQHKHRQQRKNEKKRKTCSFWLLFLAFFSASVDKMIIGNYIASLSSNTVEIPSLFTQLRGMSLLPACSAEFGNKSYWDDFFRKRGNAAFEWYGKFVDLFPLMRTHITASTKFLIPGCGNSDFSSTLFDSGYKNIVNLDFSELVIADMRAKTSQRHGMTWIVGDMTAMDTLSDEQFDFIVDKGSLGNSRC